MSDHISDINSHKHKIHTTKAQLSDAQKNIDGLSS